MTTNIAGHEGVGLVIIGVLRSVASLNSKLLTFQAGAKCPKNLLQKRVAVK
jgi:hypothetical protein